jgi:hypothetical protein
MPKDATKNVDRYKIRGGHLNEFDFHRNQEAFAEQENTGASNLIPGTPPEARAKGAKQATKKTQKQSTKKAATATKAAKATTAKKSTKATKKKSPTGASPKKLAARKAAKK